MIRQYYFGEGMDNISELNPPLLFVIIHEDWQKMLYYIDEFKVYTSLKIQTLRHQP